eukprot:1722625-Rhodomonas_salina.2
MVLFEGMVVEGDELSKTVLGGYEANGRVFFVDITGTGLWYSVGIGSEMSIEGQFWYKYLCTILS